MISIKAGSALYASFEVDGEEYSIPIGPGRQFVVQKTKSGKYLLLPEETIALPTLPDVAVREKYAGCREVPSELNKAGIYIGQVEFYDFMDAYVVSVRFENPKLSQSEGYVGSTFEKFHYLDANAPQTILSSRTNSGKLITKNPKGDILSIEYFARPQISTDKATRFVILYFDGIDDIEGCETPPLFFLIELDEKSPVVLTETLLLGEDLFQ